MKDRTVLVTRIDAPSVKTLYHQRDEKFLASDDQHVLFSPDGHLVAVTSDEDGWNHLYVVPSDGGAVRQLTKGRFEVSYPSWTPDGRAIVYCSTENGTEQRQIYRVSVADGTTTRLTKTSGVNVAAAVSPDGRKVLYLHSDPTHLPDVWLTSIDSVDSARQLADGMTPELHSYQWQTPQIVTFASQVDRLPIKAQLFVPADFDKAKKYPAIVHTHQAAIYQEVYFGPGPQKDNVAWYGFNQRLAQEGYVVLNVDYRGSYGYGRDFRVGGLPGSRRQ